MTISLLDNIIQLWSSSCPPPPLPRFKTQSSFPRFDLVSEIYILSGPCLVSICKYHQKYANNQKYNDESNISISSPTSLTDYKIYTLLYTLIEFSFNFWSPFVNSCQPCASPCGASIYLTTCPQSEVRGNPSLRLPPLYLHKSSDSFEEKIQNRELTSFLVGETRKRVAGR